MIVVFGTVLKNEQELIGEQFFIYLAPGKSGSYLAKIISLDETKLLERVHGNPKYQKIQLKQFDFEILQKTESFIGRAAVFGRQAEPVSDFKSTQYEIDEEDLDRLKQGILDSPHVIDELKKEIRKLK